MDIQNFYEGREFGAYKYLGAHVETEGVIFRTYAPNAKKVSVMGEFNGYMETAMEPVEDGNFYECLVKTAVPGMKYQYRIYSSENEYCDHCDPYGFSMELRPGSYSVICDLDEYQFQDEAWIAKREETGKQPLNIYEVHLGTFARREDDTWLTYEELSEHLVTYVKKLGYNWIQLMPLAEYPLDESWGYQSTGFFSPTSRYGEAKGLKKLIDTCHQKGIGVILDCNMASFAIDSYGLADYDGHPLYEYPHKDVAINEFGSCNFIYSKGEVRSFLQSAAYYWLQEYHCDGLRFSGVQRMVYWQGEKHRGENGQAIDFIKCMNKGVKERFPYCILTTGTITGFSKVTEVVNKGGLGFDYQWDSNWVEDTLKYMAYSPEMRRKQYYLLPFSMVYFQDEKYMMALSHDEAAHRENSVFQGIYGEAEEKFSQARAMYMYMYAHPGKVLNFMGSENARTEKWDGKSVFDRSVANNKENQRFTKFMKTLNKVYEKENALWELDYTEQGFQWTDCLKKGDCMYTMKRQGKTEKIYAVFNFDDKPVKEYTINVGDAEQLQVILNSEWKEFGGSIEHREEILCTQHISGGNMLTLEVPAFAGVYLKSVLVRFM